MQISTFFKVKYRGVHGEISWKNRGGHVRRGHHCNLSVKKRYEKSRKSIFNVSEFLRVLQTTKPPLSFTF